MRKVLLLILLVLIIGTDNARMYGQNESSHNVVTTWGLKVESNLSGFSVSGLPSIESKKGIGGTFGGFLHIQLAEHFVLQGELLYHYKSSYLYRDGTKGEFRYWGTEIPIYAVYQLKHRQGGYSYVGIGPYTEFGFGATLKRNGQKIDLYDRNNEMKISVMDDSNSGFGIMLGHEFASRFRVNAGYKMSITNVMDANSSSLKLLPNTLSLGIGYRFGNQ